MGQLERYGLYVLCLVIVLILGVAIWGGDPAAAGGHGKTQLSTTTPGGGAPAATGQPEPAPDGADGDFFAPLQPEADELGGLAAVQAPPAAAKDKNDKSTKSGGNEVKGEQARPPAAGLRTYTVRAGDTLEKIALEVLKSRQHIAEIQRLNPGVDERRMRVGTVLKLPWVDAAPVDAAAKAPADGWREYVVKHGDNPWIISKAMYGSADRAAEIMKANNIDDPRKLREKAVLRIPPRR